MRRLGVIVVCLLSLVAACGDEEGGASGPDPSEATGSTSDPAEWCGELDAMREATDPPSEEVIDSAPEEVQAPLRRLVESADDDPDAMTPALQAGFMGDLAAI